MPRHWHFWIDRGGTFTDCIGWEPESGQIRVVKVLSSDDAPLRAIRRVLKLDAEAEIPACEVRMGTTLATNALLERRGVPTGLCITQGFEDLPEIGDQTRPDLFALHIERPAPLAHAVTGIDARGGPRGEVVSRPEPLAIRRALRQLRDRGASSLAVVVIHGCRAPSLELDIGRVAAGLGFEHVSLSHEVDAESGLLARAQTTVADAYLTPLLTRYVETLLRALSGSELSIMQSSGALTEARRFRGRHAVLSGPAGGAVALGWVASQAGVERAIGFDMGGTSTDVCRWEGEAERVYHGEVGGVALRAPMVAIHTVAAGGGSVCRHDQGRLSVGPDSAGAHPGPLCYGRPSARAVTLTDVNLYLGRLPPDRFAFDLDRARPAQAIEALSSRVEGRGPVEVAAGFLEVANENMAEAIRHITIARGKDAREHVLVVFGGAGGQHACAVARRLGIRQIIAPPLGGVLSALGMGVASRGWSGEADGRNAALTAGLFPALEGEWEQLEARGRRELGVAQDVAALAVERRLDLRYEGTQTALTLPLAADETAMRAVFDAAHRERFGYVRDERAVSVAALRLDVRLPGPQLDPAALRSPAGPGALPAAKLRSMRSYVGGRFREVPLYDGERLPTGAAFSGPAIVLSDTGALVVEPGFDVRVGEGGLLDLLDRGRPPQPKVGRDLDPVYLEVFANAFMSVAEQMGAVLQRTAVSANIKERLDYSCALFDRAGRLVANAPHIPVHLGAMGETVRDVFESHPDPQPGEVFLSNDPSAGGSHLPDLTVVSPVHAGGELTFWVASRGHHADIGGVTPGSMPPHSRSLVEEGIVFRNLPIVRGGLLARDAILARLRSGPYPARRPLDNLADLEAQVAANQTGARRLLAMIDRYGKEAVVAYLGHVRDDACRRVRAALAAIPDGDYTFSDALDDGTKLAVALCVEDERMRVDFTGTDGEHEGNLNAPRAVTVAAVLYVLRAMVAAPIPLNEGCLLPIQLVIPPKSLLDPSPGRAVAGGNVETSMRVVDILLGALGLASASQGTMNNVTLGDTGFGHYETIAGGAGAGPGFPGASAVHTHMTNSRSTDPEVLEERFPLRLVRFGRRRGSGGAGRFPGGDGAVREYELLAPLSVSILAERRVRAPFGLGGGRPGAKGRNLHQGREVAGKVVLQAQAGDRIVVETPGGGGYGPVSDA